MGMPVLPEMRRNSEIISGRRLKLSGAFGCFIKIISLFSRLDLDRLLPHPYIYHKESRTRPNKEIKESMTKLWTSPKCCALALDSDLAGLGKLSLEMVAIKSGLFLGAFLLFTVALKGTL